MQDEEATVRTEARGHGRHVRLVLHGALTTIVLVAVAVAFARPRDRSSTSRTALEEAPRALVAPNAVFAGAHKGGGGKLQLFQQSDEQSTGETDIGDHKTYYLDRQTVDCGANPINGFHLQRASGDKIKYNFKCAENGNLDAPEKKATDWDEDGDGGLIFLDRLKVKCGDDSLITKFRLKRKGEQNKVL
jgi:hypothetical protein